MPAVDTRPPSGRPRLRLPWTRRRMALVVALLVWIAIAPVSFYWSDVSIPSLLSGLTDMRALLSRIWPPDLTGLGELAVLTVETLFIALAGTAMALAVSLPMAFLAARNTTPHPIVRMVARSIIVVTRAIPALVFAIIFVRALGLGPLAGALAVGIHSIGMLAKLIADSIEQTEVLPREAVTATGASRNQVLVSSVLPQTMPAIVGLALYRLDINVRTSAILGLVGAGGIGMALQTALGSLNYGRALTIIGIIFVLIVVIERLSVALRQMLLFPRQDKASAKTPRPGATSARPPWTPERRLKAVYGIGFAAATLASLGFLDISVQRSWPAQGRSSTSSPSCGHRTSPSGNPLSKG